MCMLARSHMGVRVVEGTDGQYFMIANNWKCEEKPWPTAGVGGGENSKKGGWRGLSY